MELAQFCDDLKEQGNNEIFIELAQYCDGFKEQMLTIWYLLDHHNYNTYVDTLLSMTWVYFISWICCMLHKCSFYCSYT